MKLRDVPDPVWYGLLAVAAAGGVWWLTKKAGDTLSTSLNPVSDKNVAYKGVNALGHLFGMNESDTVGTGLYGLLHTEADPNAALGSMASQERSVFDATTWGAFGRWWYTLWKGEENAAIYYGDKPASSGASGSWASPAPSSSSYSYGTAGPGGIPWRYDAKPLPDIFNFSLDYIK